MMQPQFIIAGPTSNAGKTTVTLGLLKLLEMNQMKPQPFKSGPDYIDPKFHELASGTLGVNLDLFMMEEEDILSTYAHYACNADVSCIEGVMGLFDGARKSERSTAELSKVLNVPVVLVVDAKSVAYSVAPLLFGFKNFDKDVIIAGVIFNKVNTESHYQFLKEACEDVGLPSFGYVPVMEEARIPSRHLGLSLEKLDSYESAIIKLAKAMEATVDLNALISSCTQLIPQHISGKTHFHKNYSVAIAQDEAFNFIYPQSIQIFHQLGEVKFFSPLKDEKLPDAELIYLPGGYPECYLKELSENEKMLQSIKEHAESGKKIIAECGGMMYLGKSIINQEGEEFSMAEVFPFRTSMEDMKLHLGYRTIEWKGQILKAHEFHYSKIMDDESVITLGEIKNARNLSVNSKIYAYKEVVASYMHFYFGRQNELEILLSMSEENKPLIEN